MDVTVDVRVDVRMDGRTIKPAGNCRPRRARKKEVQSLISIFHALGS